MQRNYGSYDGMEHRPEKTMFMWHELYSNFFCSSKQEVTSE